MFYVFKTKSNKEEANPKLNAKINYSNCISKEYPLMKKKDNSIRSVYTSCVYTKDSVFIFKNSPTKKTSGPDGFIIELYQNIRKR